MSTLLGPKRRVQAMTTSRFVVLDEVSETATRPNGVVARKKLADLLQQVGAVVVDMREIVLTPSFADEFLGVLLVELGEERFRDSVKIQNVPESTQPLLRTVLRRRATPWSPSPRSISHV